MATDISKNVVMVLLVLVIVVASFGTYAFLTSFQAIPQSASGTGNSGDVQYAVANSPGPSSSGADVVLYIGDAEVS